MARGARGCPDGSGHRVLSDPHQPGEQAVIFDYQRRIQALEARVQALEDALKKERAVQEPDAQTQILD